MNKMECDEIGGEWVDAYHKEDGTYVKSFCRRKAENGSKGKYDAVWEDAYGNPIIGYGRTHEEAIQNAKANAKRIPDNLRRIWDENMTREEKINTLNEFNHKIGKEEELKWSNLPRNIQNKLVGDYENNYDLSDED